MPEGFNNTKAILFSDSDDDGLLIDSPTWNSGEAEDVGNTYSLSAWVYLSSSGGSTYDTLFCMGQQPSTGQRNGVSIQFDASNKLEVWEHWDGNGTLDITRWALSGSPGPTEPTFTTNEWVHLVWTRDTSNTSNIPNIYYNGVDQGTCFIDPNHTEYPPLGTYVRAEGSGSIGFRTTAGECCTWNGAIDDVALFNKVLSAAEVSEIYSGSVPWPYAVASGPYPGASSGMGFGTGGCVTNLTGTSVAPSLVSWWRMGDRPNDTDGVGGIIHDQISNNNATGSSDGLVGPQIITQVTGACLTEDCNGVVGGTAWIDASCVADCVMGSTGQLPSELVNDCMGVCGGDAVIDCFGQCVSPPGAVDDCMGICDGTAFVNECGYCVMGSSGLLADFAIIGCAQGGFRCESFGGGGTSYLLGPCPPYYCKPHFDADFTMNELHNKVYSRRRNIIQGPFIVGTDTMEAINTNIGTEPYAITGSC